jgi:ribonuclease P protein component
VKRRIREWFRREGRLQTAGFDAVVIARAGAAALGGAAMFAELNRVARGVR